MRRLTAFGGIVDSNVNTVVPFQMSTEKISPLVAIVGPTASGKSALGIWLAQKLDGEVVACDSTQMYRGFDIGTAKPTREERKATPHHLLDVLEPSEEVTAGGYREKAIEVLNGLRQRRRLPIFTVGTGLYLRVLLEGLADVPLRSEPLRDRLRKRAGGKRAGHLYRLLERLDPKTAKNISPADEQKILRAVEVCLLTKKPVSEVYQGGRKPLEGWRAIKIGLQPGRETLYEQVHARTDAMLNRGWIEEVRGLIETGMPARSKPFDFIGYKELRAVLAGEMQLDEARSAIQQATRRYAKRQMTWFRREQGVHWLTGFGGDAVVQEHALEWVTRQL
ncbi:MAG: tRNA (adenosine(37)-N6)-dimethylallyltransferase MiaA [Candidatus Acidiferrum sp.]